MESNTIDAIAREVNNVFQHYAAPALELDGRRITFAINTTDRNLPYFENGIFYVPRQCDNAFVRAKLAWLPVLYEFNSHLRNIFSCAGQDMEAFLLSGFWSEFGPTYGVLVALGKSLGEKALKVADGMRNKIVRILQPIPGQRILKTDQEQATLEDWVNFCRIVGVDYGAQAYIKHNDSKLKDVLSASTRQQAHALVTTPNEVFMHLPLVPFPSLEPCGL